ncbi:MAG: 2,3-bisphosphoglycerate-independent phosphoglycerate mutase [Phycisphaerae bacterium]|nr:2,3-bisphosphoglycerate-independent phosphoglycerate mutase [Phycisphaerae bacterium]
MKYVIVIPDGAADRPISHLNGLTPLEAARAPNLSRLAAMGQQGTVRTTPPGFTAGTDVCCLSLLGYDPAKYHTGRAPLEAAALGIAPGLQDWVFRVNLVTTTEDSGPGQDDGMMLDHSAGQITDGEARALIASLVEYWGRTEPDLAQQFSLHAGVSYRNILIDKSQRDYRGSIGGKDRLTTYPPHEIPRKAWRKFLPRGEHSDVLKRLMERSRECFSRHEVNAARREAGLRVASMAWVWGQGTRPALPMFAERFGVRGCVTTAVDLMAGIVAYAGLDRIAAPGLTSYDDNDYAAQGRYSIAGLERYDLVVVHVKSPDEASHQGDFEGKIAAIESIDAHVIGPMLAELQGRYGVPGPGWRMLVAPDHYTLCETMKHDATPPPFVIAGTGVKAMGRAGMTEAHAEAAGLHVEPGESLMEYFLFGGMKRDGAAA